MSKLRKSAIALALSAAVVGGGSAAIANPFFSSPVIDRAAKGQVDQLGGARREATDQTAIIQKALKTGKAKNVILIIGDGMGDSEITVARNYLEGAGGAFKGLDALPLTGQMTHYGVYKDTGKPDYVPDSAATGTAWATGVKTYDNAVGVDRLGKPHQNLLELAKIKGKATGNITTSEIQDATPAVQQSHISLRSCYGPKATTANCPEAALQNGGLGSISEQLLNTRPDVTMGGGAATFEANTPADVAQAGPWAGETLKNQAFARGYNYITTKAQLAGVTKADQTKPLLALFAAGNMPVKLTGPAATSGGANLPAATCTDNPAWAAMPSLKDMTSKSIDLLSKSTAGKNKGFFLQVESASIDKQDHAADACGQIGETEQLDQAVQAALAFARKDNNTLVIVTADHAHTSQLVDGNTPGLTVKLTTNEGSPMTVAYGTAAAGGSQQHTGSQLRVAGFGPGAGNLVGLIDQTDINFIIKRAFG
ncbi:alkaline phosphatase [Nocardioides marmoriginsengisoli]|uniref:Alkaline phosphatase n=1 Tax=Nocardioides marmoriginsengisoli TaxID=661483 RepID=A0A3N0CEX2_9ACTN|nr:alkaline phosphatase [Nocardioides marmoriginsengisoli]RNL62002.1 alkaline phosphatase [Nocardioides marmoriginsengisoli]